jgi:hypothetical protein
MVRKTAIHVAIIAPQIGAFIIYTVSIPASIHHTKARRRTNKGAKRLAG